MTETATITSKSMVNIPAKIRRKYGLKPGTKIVFIDSEEKIELVPVPPMSDLFGVDKQHRDVLLQAIRELEEEHRRETRE